MTAAPAPGTTVMWSLIARCNLCCTYCFEPFVPHRMRAVGFERQMAIIGNLDRIGTSSLTFSGGDPLLVPRLRELIEAALDCGYDVDLVSNAVSFRVNPMETLADLPITFCLSIDSPDPAVNRADRVGSPEALTATIETFARMLSPKARLTIQGVTTRRTLNSTDRLFAWAADLAAVSAAPVSALVSVVSPSALRRDVPADLLLTPAELAELRERLVRIGDRHPAILSESVGRYLEAVASARAPGGAFPERPCPAGWRKIVLDPNGEAYACAFYGWPPLGNLRTEEAANAVAAAMAAFEPISLRTGSCVSEACACMLHGTA